MRHELLDNLWILTLPSIWLVSGLGLLSQGPTREVNTSLEISQLQNLISVTFGFNIGQVHELGQVIVC